MEQAQLLAAHRAAADADLVRNGPRSLLMITFQTAQGDDSLPRTQQKEEENSLTSDHDDADAGVLNLPDGLWHPHARGIVDAFQDRPCVCVCRRQNKHRDFWSDGEEEEEEEGLKMAAKYQQDR